MTSRKTPLGGVHEDERMLDQLGTRSYAGEDRLGVTLGAWAERLDAEATAATARADIGELVRRHGSGELGRVAEPATTIRIRASRLLATLGGVGVAATALGIALANGYNLPGLPPVTPSESSSSVSLNDQQLLSQALKIKQDVLTRELPEPEQRKALETLGQIQAQVTDSGIRAQLQSLQEEVERIIESPATTTRPSVLRSPTSLPPLPSVDFPEVPRVTTPAPETTPAPPERTTTAPPERTTTTTPDTSLPITGGIPVDATTTPAPTTTVPAPVPPSTVSPTSRSSKQPSRSRSRTMPSRPRKVWNPRVTSSPASASAPAGNVTASTNPPSTATGPGSQPPTVNETTNPATASPAG